MLSPRFKPSVVSLIILSTAFLSTTRLHTFASDWPASVTGNWQHVGRVKVTSTPQHVTIADGYLADLQSWGDCEVVITGRMPEGSEQVQIWGAVRVKDRHSRYVFGLRGGVEPQISLARYAPDGGSKFLGFTGLEFTPSVGETYTLRVVAVGKRFHVYLNDEALPRINIEDSDAPWTSGGVGLGGGWLPTEFSEVKIRAISDHQLAAFSKVGEKTWSPPKVDKEAQRLTERAAYTPVTIAELPAVRGEISVDGNWLFKPDYEQDEMAGAVVQDDQNWHIMPVPAFWTPTVPWLSGEFGLPGLKGIAANKGPSDKLMLEEYARVNSLTFDWSKTESGWYRHHIKLPNDLRGKRFELVFGAIAKVAEVWVNGTQCGASIGMFREVPVDITNALKPGHNVIAVRAFRSPGGKTIEDEDKVVDVAVTVPVTNKMLYSLPHGMTSGPSAGGIWQPVKLRITDPVHVSDVFIRPELDKADIEVEVANTSDREQTLNLTYEIRDRSNQQTLVQSANARAVTVAPGSTSRLELATPLVNPKLWSPHDPNLYTLEVTLTSNNTILDKQLTTFGFRTFAVEGGKLMLNGKPYWLRGGNHFPSTLRPNDKNLAHRFIELARQGNVRVTRSHAIPMTETWLKAADELGMGVSFEGMWPWLMLRGMPPEPELLKIWKEEFASLIKRHRNHPSLLYWTVNNEMKFPILEELGDDVLTQKWTILDDMIKTMRTIDPTRPIVADSAYTRTSADKKSKHIREKHSFDDGDIDDAHRYYGWYNESPFHLYDGSYGKQLGTPGRPLISQEMSTGYPRNDDWPSRSYQFPRYVPQALVGNYAFEQNDPAIFMKRQAFMTKELAEVIRRTNRAEAHGVLHFAYLTWFTDNWKADSITPKLTYYELAKALQPLLISAELFGRHFYAGDKLTRKVWIVNDNEDGSPFPGGQLNWQLRAGDQVLATGAQTVPSVQYYENKELNVVFNIPTNLPAERVDARLFLTLTSNNKVVSENSYDILLATRSWGQADIKSIKVYDPKNTARATLANTSFSKINNPDQFKGEDPLIIGDTAALLASPKGTEKLKAFVESGGRVLLLQPGRELCKLLPEVAKSYRKTKGEIVTMEIPESPLFDGINPLDTAWFEMGPGQLPYACSGTYEIDREQPGVTVLAHECRLHPDIGPGEFFKTAGAPIVEFRLGKGLIIASEMMLSSKEQDPVAARLFRNMLHYLSSGD